MRLRVQYYKKFAVPMFALIMAMLAVPFGFLVGNRGAMAGIGVSIGIAMAYWGVDRLFEQIGERRPVGSRGRGLGAGRRVRPGRPVLYDAHAQLIS